MPPTPAFNRKRNVLENSFNSNVGSFFSPSQGITYKSPDVVIWRGEESLYTWITVNVVRSNTSKPRGTRITTANPHPQSSCIWCYVWNNILLLYFCSIQYTMHSIQKEYPMDYYGLDKMCSTQQCMLCKILYPTMQWTQLEPLFLLINYLIQQRSRLKSYRWWYLPYSHVNMDVNKKKKLCIYFLIIQVPYF